LKICENIGNSRFSAGVVDTGSKFTASIVDTGGKFTAGANNTSGHTFPRFSWIGTPAATLPSISATQTVFCH
jgi:hypothetical protein